MGNTHELTANQQTRLLEQEQYRLQIDWFIVVRVFWFVKTELGATFM